MIPSNPLNVRAVRLALLVGAAATVGCASVRPPQGRQSNGLFDQLAEDFPGYQPITLPESVELFDVGMKFEQGKTGALVWTYKCQGDKELCRDDEIRFDEQPLVSSFDRTVTKSESSTLAIDLPWFKRLGASQMGSSISSYSVKITNLRKRKIDDAALRAFMRRTPDDALYTNGRSRVVTEVVMGEFEFEFRDRNASAIDVDLALVGGGQRWSKTGGQRIKSNRPLVFMFSTKGFTLADNRYCYAYIGNGSDRRVRPFCADSYEACLADQGEREAAQSKIQYNCRQGLKLRNDVRRRCPASDASACKDTVTELAYMLSDERPPEVTQFVVQKPPIGVAGNEILRWQVLDAEKILLSENGGPGRDITLEPSFEVTRQCHTRYDLQAVAADGTITTATRYTGERRFPWWARVVTWGIGAIGTGLAVAIGEDAKSRANEGFDSTADAQAADATLGASLGILGASLLLGLADEYCFFPVWN